MVRWAAPEGYLVGGADGVLVSLGQKAHYYVPVMLVIASDMSNDDASFGSFRQHPATRTKSHLLYVSIYLWQPCHLIHYLPGIAYDSEPRGPWALPSQLFLQYILLIPVVILDRHLHMGHGNTAADDKRVFGKSLYIVCREVPFRSSLRRLIMGVEIYAHS